LQRDQFSSECIRLGASGREAIVDAHIQIFRPSKSFETLPQPCKSRFNLRIIFGKAYQYADPALALRRLRSDPGRPYRHRGPNASDELSPPHVRLKVQGRIVAVQTSALIEVMAASPLRHRRESTADTTRLPKPQR